MITRMKIRCEYKKLVPLAELKAHPKNRNNHGSDQVARLAHIFEYQGIRHPIIVSNLSGFIVAGHGRLAAATKLGFKEFPVDYQDFGSEEEEYAFLVSDNAVALWAELDLSGINADIGDLGPDFDIDLLGIKNFTVEVADKEGECDEDEIPEYVEPRTKKGDIYKLGSHRLMCGDSTIIDEVERLIDGTQIDVAITDPPYGINAVSKSGKVGGGTKNAPAKTYKPVHGDEDTAIAKEAYQVLVALGIPKLIIWGGNYFTDFLPPSPCWIVWDKQRPEGLTFADGEVAWTNFSTPLKFIRHRWDGYHRASERNEDRVHPTQKPAHLTAWCIKEYAEDAKSVIDLFGGSGSSLIGCEQVGKACFMMEFDPHYVDVIVARWEKFTGQKAELMRSGSDEAENG